MTDQENDQTEDQELSSLPESDILDGTTFKCDNFLQSRDSRHDKKRFIKFPTFSPPTNPELKYGLTVWPNGTTSADSGFVIIYLWLRNNGLTEEVTINYEVSILDDSRGKHLQQCKKC